MESIFYRYRNIIVLLLVIFAQLILLAWQVKSDRDVPLVRVWAVSAVTPIASTIEGLRNGTTGFFSNYFELRNAREQSRRLRTEIDKLRVDNQLLKNELSSAQRAESLAGFQAHNPSKMIGARVIAATPGMGSRSVLIDRGSQSGVRRGMAVVTPDGIVGTVIAVFPFASQVRSVTDPGFAAGVESQKNHVHGVLKGLGTSSTRVDYVSTGQKLENGEMFFTDGSDRVFPKGLPVGKITSVREGANFQDITVEPSGTESAPEEVLVIVDPIHQEIPDAPAGDAPVFLAPDVNAGDSSQPTGGSGLTTADKLRDEYKKIGDAQKHTFGVGEPGTLPPNFNLKVPGVNAPAGPAAPPGSSPNSDKKPGAGPTAPANSPASPDKKTGTGSTAPANSPVSTDKKTGTGSTAPANSPVSPDKKTGTGSTAPANSPVSPDKKTGTGSTAPVNSPASPDKKTGTGVTTPGPVPATPPATRSPAPPAKEPQP